MYIFIDVCVCVCRPVSLLHPQGPLGTARFLLPLLLDSRLNKLGYNPRYLRSLLSAGRGSLCGHSGEPDIYIYVNIGLTRERENRARSWK